MSQDDSFQEKNIKLDNTNEDARKVVVQQKKEEPKGFIEEQKEKIAVGAVQSAAVHVSQGIFAKYSCGFE